MLKFVPPPRVSKRKDKKNDDDDDMLPNETVRGCNCHKILLAILKSCIALGMLPSMSYFVVLVTRW